MSDHEAKTKAYGAESASTDGLAVLSEFELNIEIVRCNAECNRLRKSIREKEAVVLRLLTLTEALKTNFVERAELKLKIKKTEAEARRIFKTANVQDHRPCAFLARSPLE